MRRFFSVILLSFIYIAQVWPTHDVEQDSIRSLLLNEVVISASTKETNDLRTLPASVSFISPRMIEGQNIVSIKGLSSIIPNFFVADYGSRLSTPVYIRGIGQRSTGQSIGMYVDNMPLLDKSVFDFDWMDVRQIDVLRGPQGTLYGRNAMSGIVNVYTHSPLTYQRNKVSLTAGNYGLLRAKAGTSFLVSENVGISLNGYYDGNGGYFKFKDTDDKVDKLRSGSGRFRLDWRISPRWTAQLMANYDYTDQGAFPYGIYTEGKIDDPDYNYPGKYIRQTASTNLNLQYKDDRVVFNSSTGFLYFDDNMDMDIDYGPMDIFTINQRQDSRSWTEELTIKSNTNNNYQWSFGIFGFYNDLKTNVLTTMQREGIEENIEKPMFGNIPPIIKISVMNDKLPMPGRFKTPSYGGAIFHQSTYNNLFTEGFSLTAGIRLDYEKAKLDYDTSSGIELKMELPGRDAFTIPIDTLVNGKNNMSFTEILPKVAIKYELNDNNYIYATVSNGYKTGGYNIQTFADIARNALMQKTIGSMPPNIPAPPVGIADMPIDSIVPYKPEYSWNYEVGYKGELIKNRLFAEVAAFYIDVKDIQITGFVDSGQGRLLKNAGKAKSIGFDVALTALVTDELSVSANYGFTRATFKDYQVSEEENLKGNYVPFAPQNTLSLSAVYNKTLHNKFIDRFHVQAHYNAAGRIYWTEYNDVYQNFYGLLNLKAGISKGIVDLNIWANNAFNTDYTAFYFETNSYNLAQQGRPLTFGIDVSVAF